VLAYRYGFSSTRDEKALEQVGELLGVNREKIREIGAKAIKKAERH
jgi:DNA-directed RNA polymerase sigma subunit (sigma70/sigma32)